MIQPFSTAILLIFVQATSSAQSTRTFPFEWSNDSLNGLLFEKTAMHVPVHFENDTNTYYFQLDTGSDQTFIYGVDSLPIHLPANLLTGTAFTSDIGKVKAEKHPTQKCYWEDGKMHIGTLGADFFANKIVEIDFPGQEIHILQSYDSTQFRMTPMKLSYGRPVVELKNEKGCYDFMFDTGSSLFELWTTKSLWNKWKVKSAQVDEFPITSWGAVNHAYRCELASELHVSFCQSIEFEQVWYNSNKNFAQGFRLLKIDGIVGNKPFLQHTVLLDFGGQKIGVKNCP